VASQLHKLYTNSVLPQFPPKVFFHNTSEEVVAYRRESLMHYLQRLLLEPLFTAQIAEFMGLRKEHLEDVLLATTVQVGLFLIKIIYFFSPQNSFFIQL
jgi:hypothetical protein